MEGFRLTRKWEPGYNDMTSQQATELILDIEGAVMEVLEDKMSVQRVEVTSLSPGSVVANIDIHTTANSDSINSVIQAAISGPQLSAIGADPQATLSVEGKVWIPYPWDSRIP